MRTVRQHPFLVLLALGAGSGLAVVADHNRWSDLELYAGMTGLIFVIALLVTLFEVRRRGPELFRERGGSAETNSRDG